MILDMSLTEILVIIGVILVSLTIHEMVHAFTGHALGDDTAAEEGRITLNPLAHIDPFMTVLLPIVTVLLIGAPILAAKPVPFNPDRVKWDEYGAAIIAAAGPFSNLLLAIVGAILIRTVGGGLESGGVLSTILIYFFTINVSLFVFNMLPIPPLDGSRVVYAFAPDAVRRVFDQLEQFGLFIVFGLILIGGSAFSGFLRNLTDTVSGLLL